MLEADNRVVGVFSPLISTSDAIDSVYKFPFNAFGFLNVDGELRSVVDVNVIMLDGTVKIDTSEYSDGFKIAKRVLFKIFSKSGQEFDLEVQDLRLPAILEAKDELGVWRPIEYFIPSNCGNSYNKVHIDYGSYAIVSVNFFEGEYHTKARLRVLQTFGIVYSEEFEMSLSKDKFSFPRQSYKSILRRFGSKSEVYKYAFLEK